MIASLLLVGVGGALGAMLRYGLTRYAHLRGQPNWPWATFVVNVVGSFVLGMLVVTSTEATWLLLGVGVCGGLTTFSTFAADALLLVQAERRRSATYYVIGSALASMVSLTAGLMLASALLPA